MPTVTRVPAEELARLRDVAGTFADGQVPVWSAAQGKFVPRVASDAYYQHVQGVPAATWTVTHNLGKKPAVTVVDSLDRHVVGDVTYTSDNALTITFSAAFSGKAYLS